jgi:hypothetical protein
MFGQILKLTLVLWIAYSTLFSFYSFSKMARDSLVGSEAADFKATKLAHVLRTKMKLSKHTTVLFLDGFDPGDNYYRIRYLLYPVKFVDYSSWKTPNVGGHVWNAPQFSNEQSLINIILQHHVNYVVAINHPNMLNLIHVTDYKNYIFKVKIPSNGRLSLSQMLILEDRW